VRMRTYWHRFIPDSRTPWGPCQAFDPVLSIGCPSRSPAIQPHGGIPNPTIVPAEAGERKVGSMFKTRVALLGVLALFIASGIATSTASAAGPYWHVAGTRLGQGVSKQVKLQAKGVTVLKGQVTGGLTSVVIECSNSYSEGATIEGQGNFQGQDKGRVTFEQCTTAFKPAAVGCKVVEPIKTNQIKSYLAYNPNSKQQKFIDVFEPQQGTGTNFVVLHFEGGAICPLTEAPVTGAVAGELIPIEKEGQEGLLNFPETPITTIEHEQQKRTIGLKFDFEPAIFSGAFGARLATNEQWGVFGQ
jgi:hypothetical protein